jgi:hypothetical protein
MSKQSLHVVIRSGKDLRAVFVMNVSDSLRFDGPDQNIVTFEIGCGKRSRTFIFEVKAPGQKNLAVAEGFEPSHGRINSAVPYQLGYATMLVAAGGFEPPT